jgi:predicted signal transduction protein with EAL and GGDEF domain
MQNVTAESGGLSNVSLLPKLAGMIRACMRDSDFVARFGDEEFVVVMPNTNLAGATVFASRLRNRVAQEMGQTVCCGISAAITGDDSRSLLARADSALYSAKASGRNRLFVHNGSQIREQRSNIAGASESSPPRMRNGHSDGNDESTYSPCDPHPRRSATAQDSGTLAELAIERD